MRVSNCCLKRVDISLIKFAYLELVNSGIGGSSIHLSIKPPHPAYFSDHHRNELSAIVTQFASFIGLETLDLQVHRGVSEDLFPASFLKHVIAN